MTISDLKKLGALQKLIVRDTNRLAEIEASLGPHGLDMSGMPRNPSSSNNTEIAIINMIAQKDALNAEIAEYTAELIRLENFVKTISDYQIRLIIMYRYIDMLTWDEVARLTGGNNTSESVRQMCHRYLKSIEKAELVTDVTHVT